MLEFTHKTKATNHLLKEAGGGGGPAVPTAHTAEVGQATRLSEPGVYRYRIHAPPQKWRVPLGTVASLNSILFVKLPNRLASILDTRSILFFASIFTEDCLAGYVINPPSSSRMFGWIFPPGLFYYYYFVSRDLYHFVEEARLMWNMYVPSLCPLSGGGWVAVGITVASKTAPSEFSSPMGQNSTPHIHF